MKSNGILFILLLVANFAFGQNNKWQVSLFFSTDCPICIQYTNKIKQIDSLCRANEIGFQLILPKGFTKNDAKKFNKKYHTNFLFKLDSKNELVKRLEAEITPEVFLENTLTRQVVYRGAIDDWFADVGKRRITTTAFYLLNAIQESLRGQLVSVPKTKAVGCIINQ